MTEKQEHLLQLFRELDEICKKNNLRYVMAGGTAIGVVRNEGFIPWDDDVDIYMPRDDWNKLVEISGSVLPEHRALQCVDVDRSYTNTFPRYVATDSCALHKHQIIGRDSAGEIIDVLTLAQSTSWYYVNGTEEFNATLDSVFSSVWAGEETMEEAINENLEELQDIFAENNG